VSSLRISIPANAPRMSRLKSAEFQPDECVLDGGSSVLCKVVRAQYEVHEGQTLWERTFWIDPVRLLVPRETSVNEGGSSMMRPFEFRRSYSSVRRRYLRIGSLPKDYDFHFTPPADFFDVDKLDVTARMLQTQDLVVKPAPEMLSQFKGKPVLVHFWATWCALCGDQMPRLVKLYSQIQNQEVNAIPTMVVVGRDGKIMAYEVGSSTNTEDRIRTALAKQGIKF